MLRARRVRGAEELLERLPDPIIDPPGDFDPEHQALLADSVGLALFVSPRRRSNCETGPRWGVPADLDAGGGIVFGATGFVFVRGSHDAVPSVVLPVTLSASSDRVGATGRSSTTASPTVRGCGVPVPAARIERTSAARKRYPSCLVDTLPVSSMRMTSRFPHHAESIYLMHRRPQYLRHLSTRKVLGQWILRLYR